MSSIGNDIVALNFINQQRTNEPRFYAKILTPGEKELYHKVSQQLPFAHFVWLLWSAKEAAYKYQKRLQPGLVFSPTRIICHDIKLIEHYSHLQLSFQEHRLFTRAEITDNYIHAIVSENAEFQYISNGIKQIENNTPEAQSAAVREFILERLQLTYPNISLRIEKHPVGYPILMIGDQQSDLLLSFAHHGNWVGYAMKG